MKRSLTALLVVVSFLCSNEIYSQTFQKGDFIAFGGIGLGRTFTFIGSGFGLPIGGGLEYAITDAIGVGGDVGFAGGSGVTSFYIGPKGYYHFNDLLNLSVEELDLYGGVTILYRSFSIQNSFIGNFGIGSGIYPGLFIGGRYYFSDSFGAYAELGNSYGWLKVGVAFKF